MVANILPADAAQPPPPTLGVGSKVKIQLFQKMVMLHIKLNEIKKMQQHGRKYFARSPPPDPVGQVKIHFFSEHGHVAYKIKWNQECNNMVANILPAAPPPSLDPGVKRSKFNFFRRWSCCISNKRNHECSNMVANILPEDPTDHGDQKVKIQLFQNMVMLHIILQNTRYTEVCGQYEKLK